MKSQGGRRSAFLPLPADEANRPERLVAPLRLARGEVPVPAGAVPREAKDEADPVAAAVWARRWRQGMDTEIGANLVIPPRPLAEEEQPIVSYLSCPPSKLATTWREPKVETQTQSAHHFLESNRVILARYIVSQQISGRLAGSFLLVGKICGLENPSAASIDRQDHGSNGFVVKCQFIFLTDSMLGGFSLVRGGR
jgi:hypothetical protein